ncbi:unnamed protein product, partial [Staurois parvus]
MTRDCGHRHRDDQRLRTQYRDGQRLRTPHRGWPETADTAQ